MIDFDAEKHIYTVDGVVVPSVTDIISHITSAGYGKLNPIVLAQAAARGTAVHEMAEAIDYGMDFEVEPGLEGYALAYTAFLRDYTPEWHGIEAMKAMFEQFAGTIDRYGLIDGREAIVDLKTNKSPTIDNKVAACVQTAAYDILLHSCDAHTHRYALYLKEDGKYTLFDCNEFEEKKDFDSYKLFDEMFRLRKELDEIKRRK